MGIMDRIREIESEINRTQKNKATNYHIGLLKAKLSKLRSELLEPSGKGKGGGEGFDVMKSGDARVALIGFPSVGKSTLLSTLTNTHSEAAAYEFTTLTCIPGVIAYKDATIQLLDLPGIIEGTSKGKGRGRQVIAVARTADLVLMMLDASKAELQRELLTRELHSVGLRLNTRPPDVNIRIKKTGGVSLNAMVELSHIDLHLVRNILHLYHIFNADVLCRQDVTEDEFIDVVEANRIYIRCLFCVNKVDTVGLDEVDHLAHLPHFVVISCNERLNLDYLLDKVWEYAPPHTHHHTHTPPHTHTSSSTPTSPCQLPLSSSQVPRLPAHLHQATRTQAGPQRPRHHEERGHHGGHLPQHPPRHGQVVQVRAGVGVECQASAAEGRHRPSHRRRRRRAGHDQVSRGTLSRLCTYTSLSLPPSLLRYALLAGVCEHLAEVAEVDAAVLVAVGQVEQRGQVALGQVGQAKLHQEAAQHLRVQRAGASGVV